MSALLLLAGLLQGTIPTLAATIDPTFHPPPDLQLVRVWSLLQIPSGDLLLIDQGGSAVQRLDSTGRRLEPLARPGAGPGEVKSAFAMGWLRDTLWVADGVLRRINFYSAGLRFIRSQRDMDRCGRSPWAIMTDGRCLVLVDPALPPTVPTPPWLPLVLTSGDRVTDTVGPLVPPYMRIRYADGETMLTQPFADDPLPVYSRNGRYFAWVDQRRLDPADPARIRVRTRDLATGDRRDFVVPYRPVPVPKDSIARIVATYTARPSQFPGLADSIRRRLYRPQYLPAVANALLTESGDIWLEDQLLPGTATASWRVFTQGVHQLTVTLPAQVRLRLVTGRTLFGVVLDDDDVPALVRYRLPPAP